MQIQDHPDTLGDRYILPDYESTCDKVATKHKGGEMEKYINSQMRSHSAIVTQLHNTQKSLGMFIENVGTIESNSELDGHRERIVRGEALALESYDMWKVRIVFDIDEDKAYDFRPRCGEKFSKNDSRDFYEEATAAMNQLHEVGVMKSFAIGNIYYAGILEPRARYDKAALCIYCTLSSAKGKRPTTKTFRQELSAKVQRMRVLKDKGNSCPVSIRIAPPEGMQHFNAIF